MYTILELQTNNGTTIPVAPVVKATKSEGLQEFYLKASYAAASTVEIHTVVIFNPEGQMIEKPLCFKHTAVSE